MEGFFLCAGLDRRGGQRRHLALGELIAGLAAHVFLEAHQEKRRDVFRAVFAELGVGNGRPVEQGHEPAKSFAAAVVRRGGGQEQAVGAAGQQSRQAVVELLLGVGRGGDIVGLVDDDHVPAGVLQKMAIPANVLEGVHRNDDAVVDLERVFRRGNPQAQFGDAGRVEAHQGNGEAVPHLGLELGQHRFLGQHQDTVGAAAAHQFAQDHADLDGFAETNLVGQQESGPHLQQGAVYRFLLVGHRLEGAQAFDPGLGVGQRHLPQLGFEEQPGAVEMPGTVVANQPGRARINRNDVIQQRQKRRFMAAHQVIRADAADGLEVLFGAHAGHQPFGIPAEDPHAGGDHGLGHRKPFFVL